MRRRAVLVVEYGKEDGHPLTVDRWEEMLEHHSDVQQVKVEVKSDD